VASIIKRRFLIKILVTGSQGRVGTKITPKLKEMGHEVIPFDLEEGLNIRNLDDLMASVEDVEQVIHLAAIPGPFVQKNIDEYFLNNVVGTLHVLKVARGAGVRRLTFASSGGYYGWDAKPPVVLEKPVKEEDHFPFKMGSLPKRSAYGMSKRMCEELCAWFATNTPLEVLALRLAPLGAASMERFYFATVSDETLIRAFTSAVSLPYGNEKLKYAVFNIADPCERQDYSISRAQEFLGI